jgi:Tol biopolymer transport system component
MHNKGVANVSVRQRWHVVVIAAAIALVGVILLVVLLVRPGGRVPKNSFAGGPPRILYLSPDAQERLQLFALSPDDGTVTQLTRADGDVWDFHTSPDGSTIAYSVLDENDRADLWQVDRDGGEASLLLACPEAACTWPAWSADGKRLAYERTDFSSSVIGLYSGPLISRIWILAPATGETEPLFEDDGALGMSPSWSPVDQRVAFYSLADVAVLVYDLESRESFWFDTLVGMGSWSPNGQQMAIPYTLYREDLEVSNVARVDLADGSAVDLSQDEVGDEEHFWQDASPAWSPTGEWIALGRSGLPDGTWTWGQQLWLVRPDGSESHPLVTDEEANLGAFAWRPDGRALVYIRVLREQIADPVPELWLVSLEDEQPRLLTTNAVLPAWLP